MEIIWVIFNDPTIGRLYRVENSHLRQGFNPGDPLATPILPERKTFQLGRGGVQFQRTNFALALAYAITVHKSQLSIYINYPGIVEYLYETLITLADY